MPVITNTASQRMRPNRILDHLRGVLASGHYAPGLKFYSNNTLAKRFGISPPTAGKVLDSLCDDGLVRRVRGSGTYVTEQAARHRLSNFAIITWMEMGHPNLRNSERYQLLMNFEEACRVEGCNARIINVDDADFPKRLNALLEDGLDGVLVLPPFDRSDMLGAVDMVKAQNVPITYWSDTEPMDEWDDVAVRLRFDSVQCGRLATEYLLGMGHRNIVAVHRTRHRKWCKLRMQGYLDAMAEARIPQSQRHVEEIPDDGLAPSYLISLLRRLKEQGCTAIMASNDALAYELILAGRAIGLHFPDDISITGVDNREPVILLGLTTVELPAPDMASTVLSVFKNWDTHRAASEPVTVSCRLIARTSVSNLADRIA